MLLTSMTRADASLMSAALTVLPSGLGITRSMTTVTPVGPPGAELRAVGRWSRGADEGAAVWAGLHCLM